jgi:hypothetical protein
MAQSPKWKKHDAILTGKMGSPRPNATTPFKRRGDEDSKPKEAKRKKKEGVEYRKDWESWGRRVRRDILVIEAFLQAKFPDFDPYGDPGDPPPPPDDEFIP